MKVPYSWLKDFVDIDVTPEVLADKLVNCGFEVEDIIYQGKNIKNVVTGKIEEIVKHPNADKLIICQVNVGKEDLVQIVTGATNVAVGDMVPVALHNSDLPNGAHIKKGKLRGVPSNGMMCAGEELCLTEEEFPGAGVYGILQLDKNLDCGLNVADILGQSEVVLDVSVTANRPDCNSIIGIAREVAAVLNKPFKEFNIKYKEDKNDDIKNYVSVDVQAKDLCNHYMAKAVKDIKIKESPELIKKRLMAVGIKPINNIVDITNYVLVELGQPMHAFDLNELNEHKIIVRKAVKGEKLVTLDEEENELDETNLVIADETKPVAVAGIMGGLGSGIKDNTKTVVFEAAKFARDSIRKTSRNLRLISDSSQRFEKGIDYVSQDLAIERTLDLIAKTESGTIVSGLIDVIDKSNEPRTIRCNQNKINDILGIEVPSSEVISILNSLQLYTTLENDEFIIRVPLFREDIINTNDVAEEVIRMHGYDHIQSTLFKSANQTKGGRTKYQTFVNDLKRVLVGMGAYEGVSYSFITPKAFDMLNLDEDDDRRDAIKIINPLGEDLSIMRTTLAHSMISALSSNILKSVKAGRLFEVAKVFIPKEKPIVNQPKEKDTLIIGCFGEEEDFFTMKGIVENILDVFGITARYTRSSMTYLHPGRAANIDVNRDTIGYLGEVHPDVADNYGVNEKLYIAEIDVEKLFRKSVDVKPFISIPKYPSVARDLAVVVKNEITAEDIITTIKKSGNKLLEDVTIFDVFKGAGILPGHKSVAISLTFRAEDRTLQEAEIQEQVNKFLKALEKRTGAKLR